MKKRIVLVLSLLFMLNFAACDKTSTESITGVNTGNNSIKTKEKVKILTTNKIVKDIIDYFNTENTFIIDSLTDNLESVKTYRLDNDFLKKEDYKALFFIGAGFEPFLNQLINNTDKNSLQMVNLSRGVEISRYKKEGIETDNFYYLVNTTNFKIALFNIKNSLQELDPKNSEHYDSKFESLVKVVDQMDSNYKQMGQFSKDYKLVLQDEHLSYIAQSMKVPYITVEEFKKTNKESGTSKILLLTEDNHAVSEMANEFRNNPEMVIAKIITYSTDYNIFESFKINIDSLKRALKIESPTGTNIKTEN